MLIVSKKPKWAWKSKEGDQALLERKRCRKGFQVELYNIHYAQFIIQKQLSNTTKRKGRSICIYLFKMRKVKELAKNTKIIRTFLKYLKVHYISELIDEVRIRAKKESSNRRLDFKELSEGEQQLLYSTRIAEIHPRRRIFIFASMSPILISNPVWKLEYLNLLEKVVGKNKTSQVLSAHMIHCYWWPCKRSSNYFRRRK